MSWLWFVVGCQPDQKVGTFNTPPAVSITNPPDRSQFLEGETVEFSAIVDDDSDNSLLAVGWSSDADGAFEGEHIVDAKGRAEYNTANLSPGNHAITIQVVDGDGASADSSITITVIDQPEAPEIEIIHPVANEYGIEAQPFNFVAKVDDVQDDLRDLAVFWTSDLDGPVCDAAADGVGVSECEATLSVGDHFLTAEVVDTTGETGAATSYFAVLAASGIDDDGDHFSEDQGDCDDANPTVHPGAKEYYNGIDDDCDGTIDEGTEGYDDDGDGYSEAEADCDDTDPATYPGATEVCDDADNDCDTTIDEDTVCSDDDGDGFAETEGDCDDTDGGTYPGAGELADGVDNDCDGTIDEETDAYDDDGDGYSEDDGDCDDANPAISPDEVETCFDSVDNNCSGTVDEAGADGCSVFYKDYDGDHYGSTDSQCLCSASGDYTATNDDDCYDFNASANPAATGYRSNQRGDGSYDWNCDGVESKLYPDTYDCNGFADWPVCGVNNEGWFSGVAACGVSASWVNDCDVELFACSVDTNTETQYCL